MTKKKKESTNPNPIAMLTIGAIVGIFICLYFSLLFMPLDSTIYRNGYEQGVHDTVIYSNHSCKQSSRGLMPRGFRDYLMGHKELNRQTPEDIHELFNEYLEWQGEKVHRYTEEGKYIDTEIKLRD